MRERHLSRGAAESSARRWPPRSGTGRHALERLVRLAYSAERAACYAYQGHARAVRSADERAEIQRIEAEEWEHREHLGRFLEVLGIGPSRWLEWKFACIGRIIGAVCHLIGWFMPMYFAGRLESGNVNEYLLMEELARDSPIADGIPCIRAMGLVEKRHELYFPGEDRRPPRLAIVPGIVRLGTRSQLQSGR